MGKVLIIEDDSLWQSKLQIIAEKAGLDIVKIVSKLKEAEDYLSKKIPDLIIADIHLSDGSIFDLFTTNSFKNIPTIFTTVSQNINDYEQANIVTNFVYIVKPFHLLTFQSALKNLLSQNGSSSKKIDDEKKIIRFQFNEIIKLLNDSKLLEKLNIGEKESKVIVERLQHNKSFTEIGINNGFTNENARRLFYRGLKKLIAKITNAEERFSHFLEFNKNSQSKLLVNSKLKQINLGINNNEISQLDYLKQSIDELTMLGTKWKNVLHEKKIHYIEDLIKLTKRELLLLPKFGPFVVSQIELELSKNGLEIKK